MLKPPYYPIIYVRGYAGTHDAVEDTVSTPYMGFNLGSTKYRHGYTGEVEPYVFESPLIRLMKEHHYEDAYHDGQIKPEGPVNPKSIWIFRYYDSVSKDFGDNRYKKIEFHANQLGEFINHVRMATEQEKNPAFKVILVAHSMGGLVCRCYLQNDAIPALGGNLLKGMKDKGVDKLFTYATPHGGIEFRKGFGWLEGLRDFLAINEADAFGPKRMREILSLPEDVPLHDLNGRFKPENVFCLIGTNAQDYGIARKVVGPKSDGLVQIENAYVKKAARAYTYRSHSGAYGIVNSESGYRNLERFLFGDTCIKVGLEKVDISLPEDKNGLNATYHIENIVSIRGLPVPLNKRTKESFSDSFRSADQLKKEKSHLFSIYLMKTARIKKRRPSMAFSIHFRILPTYHQDRKFLPDSHYEGQAVFDDRLIIETTAGADGTFKTRYGWGSNSFKATIPLVFKDNGNDGFTANIALERQRPLKINAVIRLDAFPWNETGVK